MEARKRRKTQTSRELQNSSPNVPEDEIRKVMRKIPATKTYTARQETFDSPTRLHASRISGQKRSAFSGLPAKSPGLAVPGVSEQAQLREAELTQSMKQVQILACLHSHQWNLLTFFFFPTYLRLDILWSRRLRPWFLTIPDAVSQLLLASHNSAHAQVVCARLARKIAQETMYKHENVRLKNSAYAEDKVCRLAKSCKV